MSSAKKQTTALSATLATLAALPIERLRAQYEHALGKPAGKTPRDHLVRALAERGAAPAQATTSTPTKPSAPAKTKAAPRTTERPTQARDPRLPAPGGTIEKVFKGKTIKVEVTADGFRHAGKDWTSLTALALHLTGYGAVSGPAFFGLATPAKARTAKPKAKAKGD